MLAVAERGWMSESLLFHFVRSVTVEIKPRNESENFIYSSHCAGIAVYLYCAWKTLPLSRCAVIFRET